MLAKDLQNKLKRIWLNIKNITTSGLVVVLLASVIIGIVALIPVILAVVVAAVMVLVFKYVYEQRSKGKLK